MKHWLYLVFVFLIGQISFGQHFHYEDVPLFWKTYDKIVREKDSTKQLMLLNSEYISKASPGLSALFNARNYSDRELLRAINSYPKYWRSIRKDSQTARDFEAQITTDFSKLKALYPELSPVDIYFTVGAFRCNGTGTDGKILIGSEMALTGETADISEIPQWLHPYFLEMKPRKHLSLLCTHEYIHTQQKPLALNLLCASLNEGIAEFLSCEVTGIKSNTPAFELWETQSEAIRKRFVRDLFNPGLLYNWLWGQNSNELKVRDLGYVVGYKIAEGYFRKATDKKTAARQLIQLDYTDDSAVEKIVDESGFFEKTVNQMYTDYEVLRPKVIRVEPSDLSKIKPGMVTFTIHFSEPLNGYNTGLDYGPLGEEAVLRAKKIIGWSADKKSWSFEAEVLPGKHYQLLVSNNFRLENEVQLKPYLIDFETK